MNPFRPTPDSEVSVKILNHTAPPFLTCAMPWAYAAVCLLLLAVSARDISVGEFYFNSDEESHAVNGLYFKDLYRTMPLRDPVSFTYNYYAHYPALGIVHWPPVFYVVEGAVFLIAGPSVIAARFTILLFVALSLTFFVALVSYLTNRLTAMMGMIFLAFMPAMLLFEKLVMLEIPCLAFCIACGYYLVRYARENRKRDAYLCVLTMSLALLTKQTAVFLPVFTVFYLSAQRKWRLILSSVGAKAACVVAFIAGPYYVFMAWVYWKTIAMALGEQKVSIYRGALAYLAAIPSQTSWMLLACALAGLIVVVVRRQREVLSFSMAWIIACLLVMALIGHKENRYVMYWLPGFALLAAALFGTEVSHRLRRPQIVASSLLLIALSAKAMAFERPYVCGYQEIARQLVQRAHHGLVLVDDLDGYGTLIFFGNIMDPQRKLYFVRKALYTARWNKDFGYMNLVGRPDDVDGIVNDYGISYMVVAENGRAEFEGQKVLRDYLRFGRFKPVSRVAIRTNLPEWKNRTVVLYQNQSPTIRTAEFLNIKMLSLGHDIVVPISGLK
jgi:Dolichyl-phosphate-mannose-protein mannosyltransferase